MQLVNLIRKYDNELRTPEGQRYPSLKQFKGFSTDLMNSLNFQYDTEQMEETGRFLIENKFSLYTRYGILERILRRHMMDDIETFSRKEAVWNAIDSCMEDIENVDKCLNEAVKKVGKDFLVGDIDSMVNIYLTKIMPNIEEMEEEYKQIENKEGETEKYTLLSEIKENHGQLAGASVRTLELLKRELESGEYLCTNSIKEKLAEFHKRFNNTIKPLIDKENYLDALEELQHLKMDLEPYKNRIRDELKFGGAYVASIYTVFEIVSKCEKPSDRLFKTFEIYYKHAMGMPKGN